MILLKNLAQIDACHPFRGRIPEASDGDARVVQMKDVDPEIGISWKNTIQTRLEGRKQPNWLKDEDVLFVARGSRNIAIYLTQVPEQMVCSPHFYHIHVKPDVDLLPEFLAWQLNQEPAQTYFARSAEGTLQRNIRRPILEFTEISLPSLEKQKTIIALNKVMKKEKETLIRLVENSQMMMNAIARKY